MEHLSGVVIGKAVEGVKEGVLKLLRHCWMTVSPSMVLHEGNAQDCKNMANCMKDRTGIAPKQQMRQEENERMQSQSVRKVGVRLGRTHGLLADSVRNSCFAIQWDLDKNAMLLLKKRGWVHAVYRFSEFGCRGGGLRERGGTTERGYAGRWARPPDEQSLWYDGRICSKGVESGTRRFCSSAAMYCSAMLCICVYLE